MSNPEQLERLKQGVEGWNGWRVDHPDEYRAEKISSIPKEKDR